MPMIDGTDYVLCTKTTRMTSAGVTTGFVVGLPNCIVCLPTRAFAGAGRTHVRTTYSLAEGPPLTVVQAMLADPQVTPQQAESTLRELASKSEAALVVETARLAALRIKLGWFSRGLYYKQPGDRGWSGFPLSDGAACAKAFARFYADQLRE
ncbi:MAG TPA: hypothetical protein ENK31_06625 [Nannocystis exedens]|nr:hypothetical protein [Nannocystis exedens]